MKKQYIVSERAHLMCPDMQFAICVKVKAAFDESKVRGTLLKLQKAHPFLHSVIAKEGDTGRLYYDVRENMTLKYSVKGDYSRLFEDYSELKSGGWNVFKEGLLKVMVYPEQSEFEMVFIAHHLLCDGRGLLVLACEFCDCYVEGKEPAYAEEHLLQCQDDLPDKSELPFISRVVINSANKNWRKEKQSVPYEKYLEFEKDYLKNNPVSLQVTTKEPSEVENIAKQCKENNVTVNDYLIARMMLQEKTSKVIIAADIRDRIFCYNKGSLGNYATAFSVISKKKSTDIMDKARDVSRQVKAIMDNNSHLMLVLSCYFSMVPELIDAAVISTIGSYNSKAGIFVGDRMFGYEKREGCSITNLGRIENPNIIEALFIPPFSPANRKVQGVLTVNGVMKVCTVSPKTI